ncbi:MAG: hypothetical protein ABH805_01540 [Candidatus Nealsonbacteria bacterium]
MKSKWYEYKAEVIKLRKGGFSMNMIEHRYGVPRSTQSGWFKNVKLAPVQKKKLLQNSKIALVEARKKAIFWHNDQKQKRLQKAKMGALETLRNIKTCDRNIIELALAILYLGEGSKKNSETAIGSSNPLILKFFLASLKKVYDLDIKNLNIRCELSLRADQNPEKMKQFWARELKLPLRYFKQIKIDKRTMGSKTYHYYKGVCNIRYGPVAIQRKLVYLSDLFCKKIVEDYLD